MEPTDDGSTADRVRRNSRGRAARRPRANGSRKRGDAESRQLLDERLDEELAETFPASDPPSLTQP